MEEIRTKIKRKRTVCNAKSGKQKLFPLSLVESVGYFQVNEMDFVSNYPGEKKAIYLKVSCYVIIFNVEIINVLCIRNKSPCIVYETGNQCCAISPKGFILRVVQDFGIRGLGLQTTLNSPLDWLFNCVVLFQVLDDI